MPTPADLDAAAADRPAVFVWQYANRQIQVLNTRGLKAADITRDTPTPKGGKIVKDPSGEPTGVIEDAAALTSKWLARPSVSHEEYLDSLEKLLKLYNAAASPASPTAARMSKAGRRFASCNRKAACRCGRR